jgi:hypothetical protein
MNGERWRPIAGLEGLYEVSNHGRVRSVARWVAARKGRRLIEGRVLRPRVGTAGYQRVTLCNGPFQHFAHVHRIVAETFVPGKTHQIVRHLDGNPLNNHASNLAWGTYADNEADKARHGRRPIGESHPGAKMTDEHVRSIRDMHSRGFSQLAIAKELSLNRGVVGNVVRGEGWAHVR